MQFNRLPLLFFLIAIFSIVCSCREEIEWAAREYPVINTLEDPGPVEEGVLLSGELLLAGPSPIADHGFVYSTNSNVSLQNSEVVSLGEISAPGRFEALADRSLEKGRAYNVRAYVRTQDGKTVYANNTSFISPVNTPPAITGFSPEEGLVGDVITLTTEGMSDVEINNRIFLGQTRLFVVGREQNRIMVRINEQVRPGEYPLSIRIGGLEGRSENTFLVKDR